MTATNHPAATAPCSGLYNRGEEQGAFGVSVPSLPRNVVDVLLKLKILRTRHSASLWCPGSTAYPQLMEALIFEHGVYYRQTVFCTEVQYQNTISGLDQAGHSF